MSFLEGQVVLLPQMIGQVGERLDRAEATLGQRAERVETTLRADISQLGQRLDGRVDGLESRLSKQFFWLLGIQLTAFVTTLAAILGVFYMRG